MDALNLKAINKKFGGSKLKNYKTISFFEYYVRYPILKKIKTVRPLNLMPYTKSMACHELQKLVDISLILENMVSLFLQNFSKLLATNQVWIRQKETALIKHDFVRAN